MRFRLLLVALLAGFAGTTAAQPYPTRPIRIVVPQEAAGTVDLVTRYIANRLEKIMGAAVVVENRSGASGAIGTELVARAAPDGYTLLAASTNTHAMAPHIRAAATYDPLRDFVPVVAISYSTALFVVAKALQVRSLRELVAYSLAHPGTVNYGSAGVGSSNHLMTELFKAQSGADLVHIPYRGNLQSNAALLAGDVAVVLTTVSTALPLVQSGNAVALAVIGDRRLDALPDVPTMREAGFPALDIRLWTALMAPEGTPRDIVDLLNRNVNRILREPDTMQWFADRSLAVMGGTPAAFAATLRADHAVWGALVRDAGIKPE